jgi:carboxymethylenebutenolidase
MRNQQYAISEKMLVYSGDKTYPIDAFLAEPPIGPEPFPGIVVIMEAFGLVGPRGETIKEVARGLTNERYVAIAPEFNSREGLPNATDLTTVGQKGLGAPDKRVVNDLEGATVFLKSLSTSNGRVGTIGFCSGDKRSLMFDSKSKNINASVDYYGGFIIRGLAMAF